MRVCIGILKKIIIACFCMIVLSACNQNTVDSADIISNQVIDGWHQIKGQDISLSLPETYQGGSLSTEVDLIIPPQETVDNNIRERLKRVKQSGEAIALLAIDSAALSNPVITNVNITSVDNDSDIPITLAEYVSPLLNQLEKDAQIIISEEVSINNNYPNAVKITLSLSQPNNNLRQLIYVIPDEEKFWLVTYTASQEIFERELATFERSIESFQSHQVT